MISALHGGVPRRKATPVSLARPHTEVLLPICWSYVLANVEVELPFAPLSALCVSRYALSPISACIRNMGTIRGGSQDPSPLVWLLEQKMLPRVKYISVICMLQYLGWTVPRLDICVASGLWMRLYGQNGHNAEFATRTPAVNDEQTSLLSIHYGKLLMHAHQSHAP
jgi:hypothetical protein